MAVQKSKKSRASTKSGRAHHHMSKTATSIDSSSGEVHVRHHVTANGYYRGKKVDVASRAPSKEAVEN